MTSGNRRGQTGPPPADPGKLEGLAALVTGAGSGIGQATAMALAAAGATVALAGRSEERLRSAAEHLPGRGHLILPGDLTAPDATSCVAAETVARFGRIDILVANAGRYVPGEVAEGDPAIWDEMLAINVNSVFSLVRDVLPRMIAQQSGQIVITGSISGYQAFAEEPVYSASKHAVRAFAHALRRQVAPHSIRVGMVAPGTVLNGIWGYDDAERVAEAVRMRIGVRSEDVAEAILFMLTRPAHVTIRDLVILPQNEDL